MAIAQTDKELLIAHVLRTERSWLMVHPEYKLNAKQQKKLDHLIKKREACWPLQYLTGYTWFYGKKFTVKRGVLIPRPSTELLIDKALAVIPQQAPWNVFDIGCGSGIIGITLALERPHAEIHCSDTSPKAIKLTDHNAKLHKCAHKIVLARGQLLEPWNNEFAEEKQAVIVANLPYLSPTDYKNALSEVREFEPKRALWGGGKEGVVLYKKLFKAIAATVGKDTANKLRAVIIEIEPHQKKSLIKLFLKGMPTWEAQALEDLYHQDRALLFTPPVTPSAK